MREDRFEGNRLVNGVDGNGLKVSKDLMSRMASYIIKYMKYV